MALSLVTKTLKDGNGATFTGQFATDGTNLWPVAVLVNESGSIVTDSAGLPVSLSSLPALATGSNTIGAVNQSGTWTVQPGNIANTTAWKVDGSGVTQPVSGTVTANAGTNLNTSALALESGGNLASIKSQTATTAAGTSAAAGLPVQGMTGGVPVPVSLSGNLTTVGLIVNPTSTLTRPLNTTAYTANQLIASSTTAGSIVVPTFTAARGNGLSFMIRAIRLSTNVTTGWGSIPLAVRLWSAAPTYSTGDGTAYTVSTGGANFLGAYVFILNQWGDSASAVAQPQIGTETAVLLASGTSVYWDIQYTGTASLTPISGQTFTLIPEVFQN